MAAIAEWLAPLPDRSLPSFDVRSTLLEIVSRWTRLESTILKQSGLGKAIMMLSNHPKECQRNRGTASKLVRAWSLPILQSADYNEEGRKGYDSGRKRRRQGGDAVGSTVVPSKIAKTVPLSVRKTSANSDFFQIFNIKH
uniref:TFIIS N-terminal domain-containing protein n=1 Tax=Panagrellus redivivus TaxID=6233 RepID=A0A7E4V7Y5_PANRE